MDGLNDWFFLWMGATVCAVFLLIRWSKRRRIQKLVSAGHFVWAQITDCDNPWKVNGKTYCCFRARYCDADGVDREFMSDAVRVNLVYGKIGCMVRVYVSEDEPDNYYIDTDSICCAE